MSRERIGIAMLCALAILGCAAPTASAQEPPGWLEGFFPNTGEPGTFEPRFQRVSADEVPLPDGRMAGRVVVRFLYRAYDGATATGTARFYLPPELADGAVASAPLIHNAGYPLDEAGGLRYAERGQIVVHPHEEPDNPMVRGPNLDRALLHACRQLPFVDDSRVFIHGGSAGGYTTLMLVAETFPVNGAAPYVPPVNWGYNAAYFFHNREMARAIPEGSEVPAQPVLAAVVPLAEQKALHYGEDFDSDPWLYSSPITHLDGITCPVLMPISTADILVPIDQFDRDLALPRDPGLFAEGWTSDIDSLMTTPQTRKTLLELLDPETVHVTRLQVPPTTQRVAVPGNENPEGRPIHRPLPYATNRQWTIVVFDEGPIEPGCGHSKFAVGMDHESFQGWTLSNPIPPEQLTLRKLELLMLRYKGEERYAMQAQPEGAADPITVVTLDFPEAEQADVLRGLLTYAADDACASHLGFLYAQLPHEFKALGPELGSNPESVRSSLKALRSAVRIKESDDEPPSYLTDRQLSEAGEGSLAFSEGPDGSLTITSPDGEALVLVPGEPNRERMEALGVPQYPGSASYRLDPERSEIDLGIPSAEVLEGDDLALAQELSQAYCDAFMAFITPDTLEDVRAWFTQALPDWTVGEILEEGNGHAFEVSSPEPAPGAEFGAAMEGIGGGVFREEGRDQSIIMLMDVAPLMQILMAEMAAQMGMVLEDGAGNEGLWADPEQTEEQIDTPDEDVTMSTEEIITTASGLQYVDVAVGDGPEAKAGDHVRAHYLGTLASNGAKFDSSYDRQEPIGFTLGQGQVIRGWDEGIQGMRVGGKRKLIVPPDLGYGNRPVGPIPAGSTLVFEVELVGID